MGKDQLLQGRAALSWGGGAQSALLLPCKDNGDIVVTG